MSLVSAAVSKIHHVSPILTMLRPRHDNGVITIALQEADDVERETQRAAMHEPYRTLLGHFRHEIGHYYWDRLVRDGNKLDAARAVFGDDRVDYNEALKAHYANGAQPSARSSLPSAL